MLLRSFFEVLQSLRCSSVSRHAPAFRLLPIPRTTGPLDFGVERPLPVRGTTLTLRSAIKTNWPVLSPPPSMTGGEDPAPSRVR